MLVVAVLVLTCTPQKIPLSATTPYPPVITIELGPLARLERDLARRNRVKRFIWRTPTRFFAVTAGLLTVDCWVPISGTADSRLLKYFRYREKIRLCLPPNQVFTWKVGHTRLQSVI